MQFPRASKYSTRWLTENPFGSNCLWLAEWLTEIMPLAPGMRVLDLGCGRAKSSIFLAREFDVQVWAVDLWVDPAENGMRIRDAGADKHVFPIHADARSLPFAPCFFDAIVSCDAYHYFGTDESFLSTVLQFLQPGGRLGFASTGLIEAFADEVPEHLREFWTPSAWTIRTADWWKRHWDKTGLVDIEASDTMPDGWRYWLQWSEAIAECESGYPRNGLFARTLAADQGKHLGYIRQVGRKRADAMDDHVWNSTLRRSPISYESRPMLREGS